VLQKIQNIQICIHTTQIVICHQKSCSSTAFMIYLTWILAGKWTIMTAGFPDFPQSNPANDKTASWNSPQLLFPWSFQFYQMQSAFSILFTYCLFNKSIIALLYLGLRKTTEDLSKDGVLAKIQNGHLSNTSQEIYYWNHLAHSPVI
jgi:hypothetical protein